MFGRRTYATGNPDAAEVMLSEAYGVVGMSLGDAENDFHLAVARFDAGPFQLDEMEITASARFGFKPDEEFYVGRVRRGTVRLLRHDLDERFGPEEIVLLGRPGLASTTEIVGYRQQILTLSAASVREAAGLEPDDGTAVFTGVRPISAARAHSWKRARDFVGTMLEADPDVAAAPLVIGSVNRMLAGLLLATFPNKTMAPPPRRDTHDARHPGTLHRAIAFIESNADLDISIGDIAAAAEVSPRAIQLAFRRHLETTPTAYLRRVRLDFAHAELIAGSPAYLTVTEVAYRWGFSSPSRFAERYRIAFGALPSETLRR